MKTQLDGEAYPLPLGKLENVNPDEREKTIARLQEMADKVFANATKKVTVTDFQYGGVENVITAICKTEAKIVTVDVQTELDGEAYPLPLGKLENVNPDEREKTIARLQEMADKVFANATKKVTVTDFRYDGVENVITAICKTEAKPEETVTVTAYFKDSNYLDVSELGTNGKMEFAGVKLSDIEAFKKQVTDYVKSKGYEVVDMGTPVAGNLSVAVIVKKTDTPTPTPEQATSKLTIQFKFGSKVVKSQELSYTGEKGSTTIITKTVVDSAWVPSGYQVSSYFDDATLTYGTDLTLVVTLRLAGGGGGTSGSGSASGSSGRIAASGVLANGDWMQDNVGWWYSFKNGSYAKNGWYTLEWRDRLDWYYFNADGYLVSGWYTDAAGNRYYLHPEHDGTFGRMYTGWNKVDGSWQFFNDDLQSSTYGAWAANTPVPTELQNK